MARNIVILIFTLLLMLSAEPPLQLDIKERAVSGYDVVAYYSENRAVQGDTIWALKWKGGTWLFSSEKNYLLFINKPEKYVPQYGGYCSWGMRYKGIYKADHRQFTVYDSKLYFNKSQRIKERWFSKLKQNIKRADKNWNRLYDK